MRPQDLLAGVERPARYLGGEAGMVIKDPARVRLTLALAFPEVYEIAMSSLGLKALYAALAPREEIAAERVYCPWVDMMDLMEAEGLAPWSRETARPLGDFDVIGFSLGYELTYTNMLQMLRLSGVPLRREERQASHPLVIAGGGCMVNPEPVADFLDLAVVGEAEELIHPLVDLLLQAKEEAWDRERLYRQAATLEGVYAPALYEPVYQGGVLKEMRRDPAAPERVRRRLVADLEACPPGLDGVLPAVTPVHDRLGVEIARGCTRGCRFCQAGYTYRPVREREANTVLNAVLDGLAATGCEEAALLSLSAGDHTCIEPLTTALMDRLEERRVGLSLPSLRMDSLSDAVVQQVKRVRKSGFTLAPEAGSQRMREAINKDLTEEQIVDTARRVFALGWNHIKLYFMIGLPGETDEDVEAIGALCRQVAAQARAKGRGRGKKPLVHASIGIFVPKPHTAFQWEAMVDRDEASRRLSLAKFSLGEGAIRAKWNPPASALLEGVLSRGDRRLSRALELAAAKGCRFDGWSDWLRLDLWRAALDEAGLTVAEYLRPRDLEERLPWDHIDVGVAKEFLKVERGRALEGLATADCRHGDCAGCGVCDWEVIHPRLAAAGSLAGEAPPPALAGAEPVKLRFVLAKTGPARWQGHQEMLTQITRALQRAGWRVAYSQGFHPHPKVKTDSALTLGAESQCESLEISLVGPSDPRRVEETVNPLLPEGLSISEGRPAWPGEGLAEPDWVTYRINSRLELDPGALAAFAAAEAAEWVRRTPKGERRMDLKAAVREMELRPDGLWVTVGKAGGRPKPAELLQAVFGLDREAALAARALKVAAGRDPNPPAAAQGEA